MTTKVPNEVSSHAMELARLYHLYDEKTESLQADWENHLVEIQKDSRFIVNQKNLTDMDSVSVATQIQFGSIFSLLTSQEAPSSKESHSATTDEISSIFQSVFKRQQPEEQSKKKSKIEGDRTDAVLVTAASATTTDITAQISPLDQVLSLYYSRYAPQANKINLQQYFHSDDFRRHAATARIYYNAKQLSQSDALKIAFQREPTNIGGNHLYDSTKCKAVFGYEYGVFYDESAVKTDGHRFKDAPNTICLYSETYLWAPPGGDSRKEVAICSVPAPALDSPTQPHYQYYMGDGRLDSLRYEEEIALLFQTIEKAIRENHPMAFGGKGFCRILVSRFGQGAFLGAVYNQEDRHNANGIFDRQYEAFVYRLNDLKIPIYQSEYSGAPSPNTILGDIVGTSKDRDFIVNAWDPHSAPGNGNDGDRSFDGAIGKSSGVLATETAWCNPHLRQAESLRTV